MENTESSVNKLFQNNINLVKNKTISPNELNKYGISINYDGKKRSA